MAPVRAPEQERGVWERGTGKQYLLELDRTVILFNDQVNRAAGHQETVQVTENLPNRLTVESPEK